MDSDFEDFGDYIQITFRKSKNDQYYKGSTSVIAKQLDSTRFQGGRSNGSPGFGRTTGERHVGGKMERITDANALQEHFCAVPTGHCKKNTSVDQS